MTKFEENEVVIIQALTLIFWGTHTNHLQFIRRTESSSNTEK